MDLNADRLTAAGLAVAATAALAGGAWLLVRVPTGSTDGSGQVLVEVSQTPTLLVRTATPRPSTSDSAEPTAEASESASDTATAEASHAPTTTRTTQGPRATSSPSPTRKHKSPVNTSTNLPSGGTSSSDAPVDPPPVTPETTPADPVTAS